MKNSRRQVFYIVGLVPILFLLAFYVLPLGVVFEKAVQGVQQTLQRADLLSKIGKPLGFTIYQAILSTLLTVLVGFPIAYVFTHFDFKGKKFFNMAVTLPFILPTVVVAAAFNSLLGSHGWLNLLLMNIFNLQ
ncbi:MAG: Putative ABC transporter permease protein, partial [Anaerolinea thermophila]